MDGRMTDAEIKALIAEEIKLHLAIDHRSVSKVPKVPNFSEFLKPVSHRPIVSNEVLPEKDRKQA